MADKTLYVIAYKDDVEDVHRTPASPELMAKLKQHELGDGLTTTEGSEDRIEVLPLEFGTSIDKFRAVAGDVEIVQSSVEELLEQTGVDGMDMFY